jgi:hypothetical protein
MWGYFSSSNKERQTSVLSSSGGEDEEPKEQPQSQQQQSSQATLEENTKEEKKLGESVHLQLDSEAMLPRKVDDDDKEKSSKEPIRKQQQKKTTIMTYLDPKSKKPYTGLNISRRRFEAWLQYTLPHFDSSTYQQSRGGILLEKKKDVITTQELGKIAPSHREELRDQWKSRQLLCDRTELLTVYNSDKQDDDGDDDPEESCDAPAKADSKSAKRKRGGFGDLLQLYADRFHGILLDEQDEGSVALQQLLSEDYGVDETELLSAASFQQQGVVEQMRILQHFLDWFRAKFPYYYDRCDACGASYKDEPAPSTSMASEESSPDPPPSAEDPVNTAPDEGTFLGYIFPSELELEGKAGRTELYQCHKCQHYTRFPRFNKAQTVWDTQRGRCGEYSMLLYRMLRAMGHVQTARWVVDWADHVWAEIWLNDNKGWIHLDPCEAAVDHPLLYQEWGKQQTYIVGFCSSNPTIQDLTFKYTSEDMKTIDKRRDETPQEFVASLTKTADLLKQRIANMTATT